MPFTWIDVINNLLFQFWPGLSLKLVRKYLSKSVATLQGHLNEAKKTRYTQVPITMDTINAETHLVFATVVDTGKV